MNKGPMQPDRLDIARELIKHYDALAPHYDSKYSHPTIVHMRTIERLVINRHLSRSVKRVLDIGCGTGYHIVQLAQREIEVVGVDISPEMIRLTQKRVEEAGLTDRVRLLVSAIDNIPSTIGSFDAAISMFGTLNHVSDLSLTLGRVASHLSLNAPLIFTIANADSRHTHKRHPTGWIQLNTGTRGPRLWTHLWTRKQVEDALFKTGYTVNKIGGIFSLLRPVYNARKEDRVSLFRRPLMWAERQLIWNSRLARSAEYLVFVAHRTH